MATEKKQTALKDTFKLVLKRSNKSIQAARATRISKKASIEYNALLDSKRMEIMNVEDELESMSDISTSNLMTSANRITGSNFDAKSFVTKRGELKLKLILLKEELVVLEEDSYFYNL